MKDPIVFSPGDRVGPGSIYEIRSRLEECGARSIVYFAVSDAGARLVVKLLKPELQQDPTALDAFEREIAARQEIANDIHFSTDEYLVATHYPGRTLRAVLAEMLSLHGRWTGHEAYSLLKKIADKLADFHRFGVHCDIKPENILLEPASGGWSVRFIDYGSTLLEPHEALKANTGTPEYESPERCDPKSSHKVSSAADMYSLGVILYEFHTGRPPFFGKTSDQTRQHHVEQDVPLTLLRIRECPESIVELIRGLLDKNPARRPDARAAATALEPLTVAPRVVELFQSERTPLSVGNVDREDESPSPRASRHSWLLVAIAVAAVGLTGIAIYRLKPTVVMTPAPPIASFTIAPSPTVAATLPVPIDDAPIIPPQRLRRHSMPRPLNAADIERQCAQFERTDYECVPGGHFSQGLNQAGADALCASLGSVCTGPVRDQLNRAVPEGGEPLSTWVSTFGMKRTPVTCRDFTAYLNRHRQDLDFGTDFEKEANELPDHTKAPLRQRYIYRGIPKRRVYDLLASVACITRDEITKEFSVIPPLAKRPIEAVSWQEAEAYCEETNERLPTEAQYERVRRWSGTGPYVWGPASPPCDALAFDQYDSTSSVHPGECRTATAKGARDVGSSTLDHVVGLDIADLGGNVREWALDGFVTHLPPCGGGVCVDPVMPPQPSGAFSMVGGSYTFGRWYMFSAMRGQYLGTAMEQGSSFRCVRNTAYRKNK